MDNYDREPCPWRILDDAGGAFAMGAVGGSLFHAALGFKNGPRTGFYNRSAYAMSNMRVKAPVTGTQFAAWGGLFSVCDCTLAHMRGKEDPLNSIASGAITGAALTMRAGPSVMLMSGIFGGVLLAMIEGVGLVMNNYMSKLQQMPMEQPNPPTDDGTAKPGWFQSFWNSDSQDQLPDPLGNPTQQPSGNKNTGVFESSQNDASTAFGIPHKI